MKLSWEGWLAAAVVLLVALWAGVHYAPPHHRGIDGKAIIASSNVLQRAQVDINAVPDNTTITFAQFQKNAGKDAQLIAFAHPVTLTRQSRFVSIVNSSSATLTAGGATITTSTQVTFDISVANSIAVTNITGVEVSKGIFGGDLTEVTLTPLANGDYQIDGSVYTGWLLGSVGFSSEIDQNGNVVN